MPANKSLSLSLNEAILLSVRANPNVQSNELGYVLQKFNTWVQQWQFYPHYSFQATASTARTWLPNQPIYGAHNYSVQPGMTWNSPIGTQTTLTSTNSNANGHYNPGISLQIMQPLMRGFGKAIVEASLNNARDTETISRLSIEGILRATVTDVIGAYLDVLSAVSRIEISQNALKRAQDSVMQTKLFIQAGRKAGNELVTVEANVASAQTELENNKNNLDQARYALLNAIGLDPNTAVRFVAIDISQLIKKYHLPSLNNTKQLILANDIQYQIDQITLHGPTTRQLLIANDNTRPILNFTANLNTGNGTGGGQNAGVNSLFNGVNQSHNVGLVLQVPIDDQIAKQAVLGARIALKQAELALMQEKWQKQTAAINGWNNVVSAEKALRFAEDAKQLQEKTYHISYQKYLHGLIDSLELQSAQLSLINAQQTLVSRQIYYLKSLVMLDLLIGNTLKTWHVKVRL